MKANKQMKLPSLVFVDDYHEFSYIQKVLKKYFKIETSYEEIDSELFEAPGYYAIFFAGSKNNNENKKYFNSLMAELKANYKEATGENYGQ